MNYFNELLFGIYPYLAGAVFLIGSWIRFDRDQYSWRAGSSQMLSSKGFRIANNLFHIGILLLFFGHLFGLLTPPSVYHALGLSTQAKQLMAMGFGGLFGIICLIGMTFLVRRRLTDPRVRAISSGSDIFILLLIYVQLILGLVSIFVSAFHLDGSQMLLLADWAQRIVTFRGGAAAAIADVNWIYKLHIFLGLTMFLVFPFTRLVHIWSAPIWYLGRSYQLVRQRG
jgi:nitrate reductase gamma subunit